MASANITDSGDTSEFCLSVVLFLNSSIEKSAALPTKAPPAGLPLTLFGDTPLIKSAAFAAVAHPAAPMATAATSSIAMYERMFFMCVASILFIASLDVAMAELFHKNAANVHVCQGSNQKKFMVRQKIYNFSHYIRR
jgi:hypothetical protein